MIKIERRSIFKKIPWVETLRLRIVFFVFSSILIFYAHGRSKSQGALLGVGMKATTRWSCTVTTATCNLHTYTTFIISKTDKKNRAHRFSGVMLIHVRVLPIIFWVAYLDENCIFESRLSYTILLSFTEPWLCAIAELPIDVFDVKIIFANSYESHV